MARQFWEGYLYGVKHCDESPYIVDEENLVCCLCGEILPNEVDY